MRDAFFAWTWVLFFSFVSFGCDDPPQIDSGHEGWKRANCLAGGCHNDSGHREGKKPYRCADCHGDNGAPERPHEDHELCGECHADLPMHGDPDAFPDPESCNGCH